MNKGKFIVFEGIDGSGKTTVSRLLYEYLKDKNYNIELTRESGGTMVGDKIRDIVKYHGHNLDNRTILLLMSASRLEHINHYIIPKLNAGVNIICDRYIDSTYAMQGADGIDIVDIDYMEQLLYPLPVPDISFLLDISIEESKARMVNRGALDHYDLKDDTYHKEVRRRFIDRFITYSNDNFGIKSYINANDESPEQLLEEVLILLKNNKIFN